MRPAWRIVLGFLALAVSLQLGVAPPRVEARNLVRPTVGQESPATASDQTVRAHNSPAMAIDPTEERFVVMATRIDAVDFGCALQLSGDGGRTWIPANPVPTLPEGAAKCYGPEVAFDRDGVLYFLFVGLKGVLNTEGNLPTGVYPTTSADRGRTFSEPQQVLGPLKFQVRMAIDRSIGKHGRLYLAWVTANGDPGLGSMPSPPNPVLSAFSDDGGKTFSEPVQVSDLERQRVMGVSLAVGPDRRIHVLYYDLRDDARDYLGLEGPTFEGHWSLVLATSTDGGVSFSKGVVVNDEIRSTERIMLIFTMPPAALAADDSGGMVTAWSDARNGNWDVLSSRSRDHGVSWAEPVPVSDDGTGRNQYLPHLAVAPNGRIDAVFYDRRNDPQNLHNDAYYALSTDRGATFGENVRLSSTPSDSRVGTRYLVASAQGLVEFGSRLGLVSTNRRSVVAWTDTRNPDVFAKQDIVTIDIVLPAQGDNTSWGWPLLALGALAVLGLVAIAMAYRRRKRGPNRAVKEEPPSGVAT